MKRIISSILLITLVFSLGVKVQAKNDLRINVNGVYVEFPDAQPFIDENNRTLVPIRFIAEQLGAKIEWYQETKTATIELYNEKLYITQGENKVIKGDEIILMDTKAVGLQGRTYVPLRFVAEGLGAVVTWDNPTQTAFVALYEPQENEEDTSSSETDEPVSQPNENEEVNIRIEITDKSLPENANRVDWLVYLDSLKPLEPQWEQARVFLMERFDKTIVDEVMDYIKLKKNVKDGLPEKMKYWITDNNRYLTIIGKPSSANIQISSFIKNW